MLLGIESSCDETAACVLVDGKVRENVVITQQIHKEYGGVVPEIASRLHEKKITAAVQEALEGAHVHKKHLTAVAVTQGPGLMGALLVGFSFAKALAWSLDIPLVGVHHLQAHVATLFLQRPYPTFPFLCLLVSGGHTQLLQVDSHQRMSIIGRTKDDSVGEAFDKTARLLGLPYPGGTHIDRLAQQGDREKFTFPKPSVPHLDYSFSGLKTAFLYFIKENTRRDATFVACHIKDLAASMQGALVESLLEKLCEAADKTAMQQISVVGGVAANSYLRQRLQQLQKEKNWQVFFPALAYCTDNAAMVAMQGYFQYKEGIFTPLTDTPFARQKNEASVHKHV